MLTSSLNTSWNHTNHLVNNRPVSVGRLLHNQRISRLHDRNRSVAGQRRTRHSWRACTTIINPCTSLIPEGSTHYGISRSDKATVRRKPISGQSLPCAITWPPVTRTNAQRLNPGQPPDFLCIAGHHTAHLHATGRPFTHSRPSDRAPDNKAHGGQAGKLDRIGRRGTGGTHAQQPSAQTRSAQLSLRISLSLPIWQGRCSYSTAFIPLSFAPFSRSLQVQLHIKHNLDRNRTVRTTRPSVYVLLDTMKSRTKSRIGKWLGSSDSQSDGQQQQATFLSKLSPSRGSRVFCKCQATSGNVK
jgi:hypothetical protein